MQNPSYFYLYRYCLFVIAIISSAIICSAAAWNLPISQNANFHTQSHIDAYMIFLGAFSLLVLISMLFTDLFSPQAFTGRVWVECLWVDFIWLLHFLGAVLVTTNLPRAMCIPQVERTYGNSCTSVKLLMAFSWICTINLFIYLLFLLGSSIYHQNRDDTVWSAQVGSYPWYLHFYCHKLGSSPELPPRLDLAPISAPQPRRPIRLLRLSVLSSLYRAQRTPEATEEFAPPPTMPPPGLASTVPTTLYPLHIMSVLEPTQKPEPLHGRVPSFTPGFAHPQQQHPVDDGGPPPLSNWPRADIMSNPPPRRMATRTKVLSSTLPSMTEGPLATGAGRLPLSGSSNWMRISPEWDRV